MHTFNPANIGEFQEQDVGNWFTFRLTTDPWAVSQGLTHEFDVGDVVGSGVRFAKILKTRAWVAMDEDEFGNAVLELWKFKKVSLYKKEA